MNSTIDIRDAFFDEIYNYAVRDNDVVIITNDMDIFSLKKFKNDYPQRFINIGVAEQNMVNIAAGLASCGKKVLVYGILPFLIYRCFEQLKFNICSMNLPVVFVGVGPGLGFSYDGPTHHGMHDIGSLNTLPEIDIYSFGDVDSAAQIGKKIFDNQRPSFIRMDKGPFLKFKNFQNINRNSYNLIKPIKDTNILFSGYMTKYYNEIYNYFSNKGNELGIVDVYGIKPLSDDFKKNVILPSKKIIVIEESSVSCGFGSIVSNLIGNEGLNIQVKNIGLDDKQIFNYGDRDWLLKTEKLSIDDIIDSIQSFIS